MSKQDLKTRVELMEERRQWNMKSQKEVLQDYWQKKKYGVVFRDDGRTISGRGEYIPTSCPFCGFAGVMSFCDFCERCWNPLILCPKCQNIFCVLSSPKLKAEIPIFVRNRYES